MTPYPSPDMIPGLDTVLVGEVEEHALAVPHPLVPTCPFEHAFTVPIRNMLPAAPFLIRECGYAYTFGGSD